LWGMERVAAGKKGKKKMKVATSPQ